MAGCVAQGKHKGRACFLFGRRKQRFTENRAEAAVRQKACRRHDGIFCEGLGKRERDRGFFSCFPIKQLCLARKGGGNIEDPAVSFSGGHSVHHGELSGLAVDDPRQAGGVRGEQKALPDGFGLGSDHRSPVHQEQVVLNELLI